MERVLDMGGADLHTCQQEESYEAVHASDPYLSTL